MVDIGENNGPQTYDFSSIDIQNPDIIENYLVENISILANRFPVNATTFGNSPQQIVDNPVFFVNDDSVFICGYATIADNFRFKHFMPYELFSKFPITYGFPSFWHELVSFDTTYNSNWSFNSSYSYNDIITIGILGYGTLQINGRQLECLKMYREYSWFNYRDFYFLTREGVMVVVSNVPTSYPFSGNVFGDKQILMSSAFVNVGDRNVVSVEFNLSQNYPNPFNPSTTISWQSPIGSWQTLKVFDVLGNEIATLVDEYRSAGSYEASFNVGRDSSPALASGIYFYKIKAGDFIQTKKMIILK